jgi:hypothetical protein
MQTLIQGKESHSGLKKILILTLIIVLALIGYFIYNQIEKQNLTTQVRNDKERIRNNITEYVRVENIDYKYSKIGGIYGLQFNITNNTDYLLENVKVKITYIKANGDVWRNIDHDFEMLSPNSVGTVKVPDTDRGVSVRCRVTSVRSSALGL